MVQVAGLFAPSLASFDETIESASYPACSLCQFPAPSIPLLCSREIFCCDFGKLKLTLGSRIFTRCLNHVECAFAEIEDIQDSKLRCLTVHCAHQRHFYEALDVFDCRLVVLLWCWQEALSLLVCKLCCLLLAHCLL